MARGCNSTITPVLALAHATLHSACSHRWYPGLLRVGNVTLGGIHDFGPLRKTNITALKNLELHMGSPLRPNPSNPPRHETAETSHQTTAGRDVSCLCQATKRTVRVTPDGSYLLVNQVSASRTLAWSRTQPQPPSQKSVVSAPTSNEESLLPRRLTDPSDGLSSNNAARLLLSPVPPLLKCG